MGPPFAEPVSGLSASWSFHGVKWRGAQNRRLQYLKHALGQQNGRGKQGPRPAPACKGSSMVGRRPAIQEGRDCSGSLQPEGPRNF